MTNEVPEQDSNDANKNKKHENVCPLSFKLKENLFKQQPFIISGLVLEPLKELFLVKSVHCMHCTHRVGQEQKISIQEENITYLIHCDNCCNIGLFYVKFRCSCFLCLRSVNSKNENICFWNRDIYQTAPKRK